MILTCTFLQVVLTISQLMWCRDMDNCLEGDHDHYQALQEFEITNFEVTTYSFHRPNDLSLYSLVYFLSSLLIFSMCSASMWFLHTVCMCLSVFVQIETECSCCTGSWEFAQSSSEHHHSSHHHRCACQRHCHRACQREGLCISFISSPRNPDLFAIDQCFLIGLSQYYIFTTGLLWPKNNQ